MTTDSTLTNGFYNTGSSPINIGNVGGSVGDLGPHTLNLNNFNGSSMIFDVGTGGSLSNPSAVTPPSVTLVL